MKKVIQNTLAWKLGKSSSTLVGELSDHLSEGKPSEKAIMGYYFIEGFFPSFGLVTELSVNLGGEVWLSRSSGIVTDSPTVTVSNEIFVANCKKLNAFKAFSPDSGLLASQCVVTKRTLNWLVCLELRNGRKIYDLVQGGANSVHQIGERFTKLAELQE